MGRKWPWIAQDNDGNELDDQMSTEVMLDPPQDYDNDQIDETTVQEALTAIQGQLGSSNSSSWKSLDKPNKFSKHYYKRSSSKCRNGVSTDPEQNYMLMDCF